MSRFEQEWALVPSGARWIAAFVSLAAVVFLGTVFLLPGVLAVRSGGGLVVLAQLPFFLLSLIGVAFLASFVLLVGYVYGDARRRGMNHVLWTLLAIFIPNAVGIILYFVLREPVPVPCPRCGRPARHAQAHCASCGAAVRPACPRCHQPVEPDWRNCVACGAALVAVAPDGQQS